MASLRRKTTTKQMKITTDPKFKFGKVSVKIGDAIKRKDLKAFSANFFKFIVNLSKVSNDKKSTDEVQDAYKKVDDFARFYMENVKRQSEEDYFYAIDTFDILGEIHRSFRNVEKTVEYWKEVLNVQKNNEPILVWGMLDKIASVYVSNQRFKEEYETLQALLKHMKDYDLYSKDPDQVYLYYLRMARDLWEMGQYKECLDANLKALKVENVTIGWRMLNIPQLYHEMSDCYIKLDNHAMAEKVLKTKLIPLTENWKEHDDLMSKFDLHCRSLMHLGECLVKIGKFEEASKTFQDVLDLLHSSPEFYAEVVKSGKVQVEIHEPNARNYLNELKGGLISFANYDSPGVKMLHNAQQAILSEDFKLALDSVKKAMILFNGTSEDATQRCLLVQGKSYAGLKMYENAISNFRKSIEIAKRLKLDCWVAASSLALMKCYLKIDYLPECTELCDELTCLHICRGLKQDSDIVTTLEPYLKSKRFDTLFKVFDNFFHCVDTLDMEDKGRQLFALVHKAMAQFLLKDYETAKTSFQQILQDFKDDRSKLKFMALLYFGNTLRQLGESSDLINKVFDEALDTFESMDNKKLGFRDCRFPLADLHRQSLIKPLRSSLLLNKCVVQMEKNKKADPNKILNLLNRQLVTTGIFNTIVESDVKKILKLMMKQYKLLGLESVQPENYVNSICIIQHFKSSL